MIRFNFLLLLMIFGSLCKICMGGVTMSFLVKQNGIYYVRFLEDERIFRLTDDLDMCLQFMEFRRDTAISIVLVEKSQVKLRRSDGIFVSHEYLPVEVEYVLNEKTPSAYKHSVIKRKFSDVGDSVNEEKVLYNMDGYVVDRIIRTLPSIMCFKGEYDSLGEGQTTRVVNDIYCKLIDRKLYVCKQGEEMVLRDNSMMCGELNMKFGCCHVNPSISSNGKKIICEYYSPDKNSLGSVVEIDLINNEEVYYDLNGKKPQYSYDDNFVVYSDYAVFNKKNRRFIANYSLFNKKTGEIIYLGKYEELKCIW